MKKIVSLILTLVIAFSIVTVSADVPDFLVKAMNNYSAEYSLSMTFESNDELLALLEELEMPEEVNNFVDIKALLQSLLTNKSTRTLQADMSEDPRQIEMGLTSSSTQKVVVNQNLGITADMKMGMWIKMDLDAPTPVFEIIYSHPMLNKYMVMDLFELVNDEEVKVQILDMFNALFNKDYIDSINEFSLDLINKYAKVSRSGRDYIIKIDNDGLWNIIEDFIPFMEAKTKELMPQQTVGVIGGTDGPTSIIVSGEEDYMPDLPYIPEPQEFPRITLLGKDGITLRCTLSGKNITRERMTADIEINLPEIAALSGEEWQYASDGILDFTIEYDITLSKIGSTKVDFPVLDDGNSFNYADLYAQPDYDDNYYEEYTPHYPHYYVGAYAKELPVLNGEYYVPLRSILEDAYYDQVAIGYNAGYVTAVSDYFPGFKEITFCVNSDIALIDGVEHKISPVIMSNGTVYVGCSLFEDTFGWHLEDLTHYILDNSFSMYFITEQY